jgi:hypothetical protein
MTFEFSSILYRDKHSIIAVKIQCLRRLHANEFLDFRQDHSYRSAKNRYSNGYKAERPVTRTKREWIRLSSAKACALEQEQAPMFLREQLEVFDPNPFSTLVFIIYSE